MDFYNNVAAVAAILMFAKCVTHRSRKTEPDNSVRLTVLHTISVVAAAGAIVVSLIATESSDSYVHILAAVLLSLSGLILVGDVLMADWAYENHRPK